MKKEEALQRLKVIETEVQELQAIVNQDDDKTKEMQDFLLDTFNGLTLKILNGKPAYYKGDSWMFQQDNKNNRLWVNNLSVWLVFEIKYGLNYKQTQAFIRTWVEEVLNWKGLTPVDWRSIIS